MLFYMGLLFLVIAVSLDGFGVGISYGMRNIHVPFIGISIITLCSGIVVFLSMTLGNYVINFIPSYYTSFFGGIILILIGLFVLLNTIIQKAKTNKKLNHRLKSFQSLKTVIQTPEKADLDKSGVISIHEALLLGIALALDAFGAGIGAAFIGYSPLLTTLLIACMSGAFLFTGLQIGLLLSKNEYIQKLTFVPPLLLISLGLINILL
ncbi:MAG TPA: sporulation membrane protein YtaF [Bacillota bacterium]|nr:sporulation membrane protein YtaF [Bacillota bacterium]